MGFGAKGGGGDEPIFYADRAEAWNHPSTGGGVPVDVPMLCGRFTLDAPIFMDFELHFPNVQIAALAVRFTGVLIVWQPAIPGNVYVPIKVGTEAAKAGDQKPMTGRRRDYFMAAGEWLWRARTQTTNPNTGTAVAYGDLDFSVADTAASVMFARGSKSR